MTEGLQTFLDEGASFEGKIAFTGMVRIDGRFKGEASADGTLVIGERGSVEADLELGKLVVLGRFKGTVKAKETVEVGATGVIEGDVTTPRLSIADGATLTGSVSMGERTS